MIRKSNEQGLGEVISQLLQTYRLKNGLLSVRVRDAWSKLMEKAIIQRTTSLELKNGILFIRLNSSVVKQELVYRQEEIRSALNTELKEEVIKEVVIL